MLERKAINQTKNKLHACVTGRTKHMTRPGLKPRTPRRPCKYSDY